MSTTTCSNVYSYVISKQLKEAMLLLIANDAPLGPEWLDHPLKGDWADHREATSVATFC